MYTMKFKFIQNGRAVIESDSLHDLQTKVERRSQVSYKAQFNPSTCYIANSSGAILGTDGKWYKKN